MSALLAENSLLRRFCLNNIEPFSRLIDIIMGR
jgi:hypothetical protein